MNVPTISEYIKLYEENDETQMDLLSEPFKTLGRDSQVPNAVATTFIISINQIKEWGPKAIEKLSLYWPPARIEKWYKEIFSNQVSSKDRCNIELIKSTTAMYTSPLRPFKQYNES